MRSIKNSFFYLIVRAESSTLMYLIILKGKMLEVGQNIASNQKENRHWNDFTTSMSYNLKHPLAILLAKIVTIILVVRFFGWVCRRIG